MNTRTGTPEPLDDRPSNHGTERTHAIRPAYYADPHLALYTGDAIDVLSELPKDSVHCVVTSPPYWALRDYGTATWIGGTTDCAHSARPASVTTSAAHRWGNPHRCQHCGALRQDRQYGLETTAEDYVNTLRAVFAHLRRVLVATGTVWLNLGDSYSAAPPRLIREPLRGTNRAHLVPRKNLWGMPWRVAFALQADGWILRNAIVWHKPNAMPESVRDRLSTRYEMLFLFAAQQRYWFDLDAIREPPHMSDRTGVDSSAQRRGESVNGKYSITTVFAGAPPGFAMTPTGRRHTAAHPLGRNPGDVWSISTRPLREAHFAAFPVDIPLHAIAAGCPPQGTVLDPFSGAATTALAARQLDRSYIGIDLNPEFHAIGLRRLGLDPTTTSLSRSAA